MIEIIPQISHSDSVSSVAFSPDGKRLLSGSADHTLKLWDAATGRLIRTFAGHSGEVRSVAFSPDGKRLLSGSVDKTLKLWDAASGRLIRTLEGHAEKVTSVAFSPDGLRLLSGSNDKSLKLWDATTGQLIRTLKGHSSYVSSAVFSPDGNRLLSGSWDYTLKLWDATTGQLLRTFKGHSNYVNSVAFSPDGTRLLSSSWDSTLKLWDAATGQLIRTFEGHSERHTVTVTFSPDGTRIVSGSTDTTIKLWDAATGQLLRTFEAYSELATSVAFSPDGTRVLSGGHKTVNLWDTASGRLLGALEGHADEVNSVAFSPDGARLLSGSNDNTLELWDTTTGQLIRAIEAHSEGVSSVAFSADGTRLLSGSWDNTLKLWDAATGQLIRTFEGHSKGVKSVAFSPGGTRLLSGGGDKTVKLWDTATGQLIRAFEGHSEWVNSVAFSPNGERLLSGSFDRTLKLWDAATGRLIRTFKGHSGEVRSVTFSPDGTRVLSTGWAPRRRLFGGFATIRLWDVASGQLLRTFEGHSGGVISAAFSPDGGRLLSGGEDNTLKLWDTNTGQLIHTFEGHSGFVTSVAFSPVGTRIVSASRDTTIRVWDAAVGSHIATLIRGRGGEVLTITTKGFFAAAGKGTELLSVVRELNSYSVMQFYDHLHRPDLVAEMLKGDTLSLHKFAASRLNLESILNSGPVPRIERLPGRTVLSGQTATLAVRLIDQGGGIGTKVIWRVNGRTQGKDTAPGLGEPPMLGNYAVMEQTLAVDPRDKTQVEIVAYNGKGLLATPPLRFSIDAWGEDTGERARLFILAIGVGQKYLKPFRRLQYAAKDATALADALEAAASEKVDGTPMFAKVHVKKLVEEQVTERSIAAEFDRLEAGPRDVFVLFLGGHGVSDPEKGWVFIPQDLNTEAGHRIETHGISDAKLKFWLREKVRARKTLLILDACESSAVRSLERQSAMAQLEHAIGAPIISAAPEGKAAYESSRLGHGLLTYAILEALNRPEGATAETVSVSQIWAHVSRQVPALSLLEFGVRQLPDFSPGTTEGGRQDFPLGVRTLILRPTIETQAATVAQSVPVRVGPSADASIVEILRKGAQVRIILLADGSWARVVRNEKDVGYVPSDHVILHEPN